MPNNSSLKHGRHSHTGILNLDTQPSSFLPGSSPIHRFALTLSHHLCSSSPKHFIYLLCFYFPFFLKKLKLLTSSPNMFPKFSHFLFFKTLLILRERKREREKHQCVVSSRAPPTGDMLLNPGMCPDWELNWWPFGSQAGTQSTEPHQPGPDFSFCFEIPTSVSLLPTVWSAWEFCTMLRNG